MKKLDWSDLSNLGLLYRINTEILHPLGLAITRNVNSGSSDTILVADDGIFEYSPSVEEKYKSVKQPKSHDDVLRYIEGKQ